MARLGRGQPSYQTGHSKLGPPQVVGPVVVYPGPKILANVPVQVNDGDRVRRATSSVLRPPQVVGVLVIDPVDVTLVNNQRQTEISQRRRASYDLGAPAYINAGGQTGYVGTQLADSRNARSDGRRLPSSRLSAPAVVTAATTFIADPVRVWRTEPHRPIATKSALRPPTVVDPVQVYTGPPRVLAEPHRPATTHPELRPPTVVDPVQVYGPVDVELAKVRQSRPVGHGKLSQPQVVTAAVTFIADPVRVARAEPHKPAATRPRLTPPTVIDPVQVYGPVDVELAKVRQTRPVGHTKLSPPQVVGAAFVADPVKVARADAHRPAATRSRLTPPTVVGPVQVYPSAKVSLTEARKPRLVQSDLKPPQVVITAGPTDDTVDVTLAPSRDVPRRLAKSDLRPPQVVGPAVVYPPVSTQLAPSSRLARASHPTLSPPAVVTERFYADPVSVTLRAGGRELSARRLQHSTLRDPVFYPPVEKVLRVSLADHYKRREYRSFLTQFFGILQVIAPVLGHFDEPTPAGAFFDEPTPGASVFDEPTPGSAGFDEPTPAASMFDEPTPTAGHFDEPTPT